MCHLGRLLEESTGELQAAVTDLRLAQGRCQRLEAKVAIKVGVCNVPELFPGLPDEALLSFVIHLSLRSSG